MRTGQLDTKDFYDAYWPANVPDKERTRAHILGLLGDKRLGTALDAGCGTGVCSAALSERAARVVSCDLSMGSLRSGCLASAVNADLLELPFKDKSFDFILSWGAIHHTREPLRALRELSRVLDDSGQIIIAVYLRTRLTFAHELARKLCLKMDAGMLKRSFIRAAAFIVRALELAGKRNNVRDDNVSIEAQVEDWFFVPIKHFFSVDELRKAFENNGLSFEVLCPRTGRLKSSSNIIVRGYKNAL